MTKAEQELQDRITALQASIAELSGQIDIKDDVIAGLHRSVAELTEKLRAVPQAEGVISATLESRPAPLDEAIQVLKDNGFKILTEVKIEDCRDDAGQRHRTFRNQGRYEVALVLNRTMKG